MLWQGQHIHTHTIIFHLCIAAPVPWSLHAEWPNWILGSSARRCIQLKFVAPSVYILSFLGWCTWIPSRTWILRPSSTICLNRSSKITWLWNISPEIGAVNPLSISGMKFPPQIPQFSPSFQINHNFFLNRSRLCNGTTRGFLTIESGIGVLRDLDILRFLIGLLPWILWS